MVRRYEDWPKRLSNFLTEQRAKDFCYGENDCLQFSGKAVQAVTGQDFFSQYGKYDNEEQALSILNENGGIRKIICKHLGMSSKNILKAKRGDVCLIKYPDLTACVVDDSGKYVALVTKKGLMRKSINEIICFWSV